MPWVAALALVGTLAIAGLPPLNGFVSEWLLLQSFLFTPQIPHAFHQHAHSAGAAVLALTVALAAYVMVKFYGVIFLGQPREPLLTQAHDANWLERLGLGVACRWMCRDRRLAAVCIASSRRGDRQIAGRRPLTPVRSIWRHRADCARTGILQRLIFLAGIFAVVGISFVAVRLLAHGRIRRTAAWDCGYPWQTRACRTRRKDLASRSDTCSEPSCIWNWRFPRPQIIRHVTACISRTVLAGTSI